MQVPPSSLGHSKRGPAPHLPEGSALALTGAGSPRDHLYLVHPDWGGGPPSLPPLQLSHPGGSGQDLGSSFSGLLALHPLILHLTLQVVPRDSVIDRRHSHESCPGSIIYCSVLLGRWLNLSEPHLSAGSGNTFLVGFWGKTKDHVHLLQPEETVDK